MRSILLYLSIVINLTLASCAFRLDEINTSNLDENCTSHLKSVRPSVDLPLEYAGPEISKLVAERTNAFQNQLRIIVKIKSVQRNYQEDQNRYVDIFDLIAYFVNTSDSSLIVRIPQIIGFVNDPGLSEGANYDLTIRLQTAEGAQFGALNDYAELSKDQVTKDDFVLLDAGESQCIPIKSVLPSIVINGIGYTSLPPGKYLLSLVYENYMIGYSVPLAEAPPSNLGVAEKINWNIAHKKQADINAWVGATTSDAVSFEITN